MSIKAIRVPQIGGTFPTYRRNQLPVLVTGTTHPMLGQEIAKLLKIPMSKIEIKRFECGEPYARAADSLRGKDIFVLHTINTETTEKDLEQLKRILGVIKRTSFEKAHLILTTYPYARQDRRSKPGEPISAADFAKEIQTYRVNDFIFIDLHNPAIEGYFDMPVTHLTAWGLISSYFKNKINILPNLKVGPTDKGRMGIARLVADDLFGHSATEKFIPLMKWGSSAAGIEKTEVYGDVAGNIFLLIDDMIDGGGTVIKAVDALVEKGATNVYVGVTHPIFSGKAPFNLQEHPNIAEIVVTDTINIPSEKRVSKLTVLSIAPLLAAIIRRIYLGESLRDYEHHL